MGRKQVWFYSEKLADEICERVSSGETIRSIARDEHIPSFPIIYKWMEEYPEFGIRIANSRKIGYDAIAYDALEIANTPLIGETREKTIGPDGIHEKVKKEDMLGHRKLQVWTRLQLLAKWYPQKYGEKIQQEITGKDGGPLKFDKAEELTDEQLEKMILANAKPK